MTEKYGPSVRRWFKDSKYPGADWYRHEINEKERPGLAEALDFYWPDYSAKAKIKVFCGIEWAPAGDGCVRIVSDSVVFHRVRRHTDGLEWQKRGSKEWVLNPDVTSEAQWDGLARKALDYFWPPQKDTIAASIEPSAHADGKDKIAWTFVAIPEKIDIARCLREAYEAGAREVTINNDGQIETYCWPDTYNHTILPWCVATKTPFPATNRHKRIGDWIHIEHSALACARAWEAEERTKAEKARRVRVTVVGTR